MTKTVSIFKSILFSLLALLVHIIIITLFSLIISFAVSFLQSIPLISQLVDYFFLIRGDSPGLIIAVTAPFLSYYLTVEMLKKICKHTPIRNRSFKILGWFLMLTQGTSFLSNAFAAGGGYIPINIAQFILGYAFTKVFIEDEPIACSNANVVEHQPCTPSKKGITVSPITICSVILLLGSLVLNAHLIRQIQLQSDELTAQEEQITSLKEIKERSAASIQSQKKAIQSLSQQNEELRRENSRISAVWYALAGENIGSASYNFKSDQSLIVVRKGDKNYQFTLTAYWNAGGTVYVDYSNSSAFVSFDKSTWSTSTTMTVNPRSVGATVVTFSNSIDSNTFKILIVVTE